MNLGKKAQYPSKMISDCNSEVDDEEESIYSLKKKTRWKCSEISRVITRKKIMSCSIVPKDTPIQNLPITTIMQSTVPLDMYLRIEKCSRGKIKKWWTQKLCWGKQPVEEFNKGATIETWNKMLMVIQPYNEQGHFARDCRKKPKSRLCQWCRPR